MKKCDFCEKYQPDSDGIFKCQALFPENYCKAAINRMMSVNLEVVKQPEPEKEVKTSYTTEDVANIISKFFGGR